MGVGLKRNDLKFEVKAKLLKPKNKDLMIKFKLAICLFILIFTLSCGGEKSQTEQQTPVQQSTELNSDNLRSAALSGDMQTVNKSIEQGIPVDDTDELGRTALMFAAFNGHNELVDLLIENGAEVDLENDEGRTSLMFAASGPFSETVSLLLENGADVNRSDSVEEWTPLMYAAAEGNREVVKLLLEHGANPRAEDADGETALDFAENNGHTETVTLLSNSLTQ